MPQTRMPSPSDTASAPVPAEGCLLSDRFVQEGACWQLHQILENIAARAESAPGQPASAPAPAPPSAGSALNSVTTAPPRAPTSAHVADVAGGPTSEASQGGSPLPRLPQAEDPKPKRIHSEQAKPQGVWPLASAGPPPVRFWPPAEVLLGESGNDHVNGLVEKDEGQPDAATKAESKASQRDTQDAAHDNARAPDRQGGAVPAGESGVPEMSARADPLLALLVLAQARDPSDLHTAAAQPPVLGKLHHIATNAGGDSIGTPASSTSPGIAIGTEEPARPLQASQRTPSGTNSNSDPQPDQPPPPSSDAVSSDTDSAYSPRATRPPQPDSTGPPEPGGGRQGRRLLQSVCAGRPGHAGPCYAFTEQASPSPPESDDTSGDDIPDAASTGSYRPIDEPNSAAEGAESPTGEADPALGICQICNDSFEALFECNLCSAPLHAGCAGQRYLNAPISWYFFFLQKIWYG